MHEPFDITTIIFALLAIFVVWKLSSVLGMRTGHEKPPADPFSRRAGDEGARREPAPVSEGNVIRLPGAANDDNRRAQDQKTAGDTDRWAGFAEPSSPLWNELQTFGRADPGFDPKSFLEGAKSAYEMIITAFAAGNKAVLRGLVADDVFASFSQAIADREARGEKVEMTLVSIDKTSLEHAQVQGSLARLTVIFAVKLITATRDKTGAVIDGSADKVVDVSDLWSFARTIGSRDPNWKLVATEIRH
jgi:predicted lipid-binding transport protein (Tim44 family)